MGKLFDQYTNIIFQSPDPLYKVPNQNKRWILLPVIAYKVLVPYPKDKSLNFFQETILKLFQSGNKTDEYIANKLLLHKELVQFVIKELVERKYLSKEGLVTEEGKQMLVDQNDQYDLKTGYVFYDVHMKSYWDAFVFDDQLLRVIDQWGSPQKLNFSYGSVGDPRKRKGVIVIGSDLDTYPEDPSNKEILTSIIRFKRRKRNLLRGGYQSDHEVQDLPKNISKVKFLGEKEPLLVPTYIFLPGEQQLQSNWQVCHPFEGGTSFRLKETLDQIMDQQPLFKETVTDLINSTLRVSELEMNMVKNEKNQEAFNYMTNLFSEKVNEYPTILKGVVEFYGLFKDIKWLKRTGKNNDISQAKYRDFVNKAYTVLEEALYLLKEENHNYFNIKYLANRPWSNAEVLSVFAEQCGFQDDEMNQVFKGMLSINKGSVEHGNKEMRSLLATNLLMAKNNYEHAFYKLAKNVPPFIIFLLDLKKKRDSSSHSNDTYFSFESLEMIFPRVLYCISHMFDGLLFQYNQKFSFKHMDDQVNQKAAETDNIDERLYYLAENEIEEKVGKIIREFPVMKTLLIDVLVERKNRGTEFAKKSSKVIEEIFRMILTKVLDPNAVKVLKKDMHENLRLIDNHIGMIGFQFKIDQLPDSFKNVSIHKIKKEFKNPKILSTKIYATLFSSLDDPAELLVEIASTVPDLILYSTKLNDIREHGSNITHTEEEYEKMSHSLFFVVHHVLPVFKKYGLF